MGPTKPPTKAEREYQARVREMGCIACRKVGGYRPAEIHHVVEGRKRLGHRFVLPLDEWHHRGIPPDGMTASEAEGVLGPSLARSKRKFTARFGTERELMAEVERRVAA